MNISSKANQKDIFEIQSSVRTGLHMRGNVRLWPIADNRKV
jgi:hypothetical protein